MTYKMTTLLDKMNNNTIQCRGGREYHNRVFKDKKNHVGENSSLKADIINWFNNYNLVKANIPLFYGSLGVKELFN